MPTTRLFDFLYYQLENFPQEKAFGHKLQGKEIYYSTESLVSRVNAVSRGLLKLGIVPGDKIALISYKNRPEWIIMDLGMMQIGAINVPVYPTISPREYEYIFNDASVKYCFVGDGDLYEKVQKAKPKIPSLQNIYTFDKRPDAPYWEEIWEENTSNQVLVERLKTTINPEDLATIIYTSGTTGEPKGVMLSHKNIASNVRAVRPVIPMQAGERSLSFLPLCHIFERTCYYAYTYIGANVTFTGTDNLGGDEGDLKAVKPHFFTTVPRLLEKVYEKIYNKGLHLTGIKRGLFFWALKMTDDYEFDKKYSGLNALKRTIADKLIFSKWREALGGNVKGIITGAAACPTKILRIFSAAGIPVREGYGLTESSPGISISRLEPGGAIIGCVGPALAGISIKIDSSDGSYRDDEGEILAAGDNIMMGYYGKPDKTAEVIKEMDGKRWLCTGDIGKLVTGANGVQFLKITDRKKELFKTSGGKYVAPAPIENRFRENFLIEQIMIIGENQKFVAALIVPAIEALKDWCENNEIPWTNLPEILKNSKVIARYQETIDKYNPEFSHIEQIKKFRLLSVTWDTVKKDNSDAELTPTLKLKRRVILEKYKKEIDEMYN